MDWLLIILVLTLVIIGLIVLFIPQKKVPLSDAEIVEIAAQNYGVSKITTTPEDLRSQLIISTLGDESLITDVDGNYLPGLNFGIQALPASYLVGDIYVLNYMAPQRLPIIINNSFEVFLSAANLIVNRGIKATLLFSLFAFGSTDFYVISTEDISSLDSTQIYPWLPLQYNSVISSIGPQKQNGFFSAQNYV